MILYNQTKNQLEWDSDGKHYTCEPWGPIDVEDGLGACFRRMGLPLGVSPIAQETRATVMADSAKEAARADELRVLAERVKQLEAQARTDQAQLEVAKSTITQLRERCDELGTAKDLAVERARVGDADAVALRAKILEMATDIAELESKLPKQAPAPVESEKPSTAPPATQFAHKNPPPQKFSKR